MTRHNNTMRRLSWHVARWVSQRSVLLTGLAYKTLFRVWEIQGKPPVVVYQMAKVGSSTVTRSLKATKKLAVFQVHNLRSTDIDASLSSLAHNTQRVPSRVIWESRYINKKIGQNDQSGPWHMVTLVREPIARNVSAFFQNIEKWYPAFFDASLSRLERLEKAKRIFFAMYPHDLPLTWFDTRLLPVAGINVFKSQFPVDKGYDIFEEGRFRLLLIRAENINTCYASAFEEFLGIGNFQLLPANVGHEKQYSELYRDFLNEITFPESYVDRMYNTKYMRHFYTKKEISSYRKRWLRADLY